MRNTISLINLSNLIHNYTAICKKVGNKCKVMPVVKANAYGHGVLECVEAYLQSSIKPNYFAVALLEEALQIRKKYSQNVLVFGRIESNYYSQIIKNNITPTFWFLEDIKQYNEIARKLNKKAKFHLEIDTGMRRTGIQFKDLEKFIELIKKSKNIYLEGVFTHFATSDAKNKEYANYQLQLFKNCKDKILKHLPTTKYFHCANSGAILDMIKSYFNMVRPGISLYGYYPSMETSESIKLKPVMSIITHYTNIKWVEPNESISYSRTYFTKKRTQIITLPIGYADGYNRLLSNKGRVIINNKLFPVVGRVCMDYIMVDIGNENILTDDDIVVMGSYGNHKFDAQDMSNIIKTIPYEICTSISNRVKRIYKN